jgi:superfamily II DNA/RNA helicase
MAVSRPQDTFTDLGIPGSITKLLAANGIVTPTPIQASTMPDSLAGRDVLGRGQTGSGKTYAFLLPMLTRLSANGKTTQPGRPRALILAPTRELATQIDASLAPLAKALRLSTLTVFGGVGARPQIAALRKGVDIVVACPGRLNEHVEDGHARLDAIEITILDEADHMADLGFLPTVRRLMERTPKAGQRLLFSATLDGGVDVLARQFMHKPVTHSVDSELSPVEKMTHHVLHLRREDRLPVLVDLASAPGRTLVFTRTKHGAKKLAKQLNSSGVPAVELHGNLAQNARNRNLQAFSDGTMKTLVATDIAARGIHVDDVALVIHADPPTEHKAYLHRSGRTARAGASGMVITLTTEEQVRDVRDLTRKAGITPTTTQVKPGDAILATLAPGKRSLVEPAPTAPRRQPSGSSTGREQGGTRSHAAAEHHGTRTRPAERTPRATRTQQASPEPGARRQPTGRAEEGARRQHAAPQSHATGKHGTRAEDGARRQHAAPQSHATGQHGTRAEDGARRQTTGRAEEGSRRQHAAPQSHATGKLGARAEEGARRQPHAAAGQHGARRQHGAPQASGRGQEGARTQQAEGRAQEGGRVQQAERTQQVPGRQAGRAKPGTRGRQGNRAQLRG